MQIKERGNTVRLIRTGYDAEAKSPTSDVIARTSYPELVLDEADKAKLTPDEAEEFEAFRAKSLRGTLLQREFAAYNFGATVKLVSEWLSSAPREEALALGASVQKDLKQLRRLIESLSNTGDAPANKRIKRAAATPDDDDGED